MESIKKEDASRQRHCWTVIYFKCNFFIQTERDAIESDIEEQTNWVAQVRDKLAQVDDVTGADEELVQRLDTAKVNFLYQYLNNIFSICLTYLGQHLVKG